MSPLKPVDLQAYMHLHGIQGEMLVLDAPTPTVEAAARAVGAPTDSIVKSILFFAGDRPVLAVSCGARFVERRAIAAVYGVGRKQVRLADPEVVLQTTGYEVGAMPPFGHLQPIPTLIDSQVLEPSIVFAGGGAENALIRLDPREILRASGARVMDLHEKTDENRSSQPAGNP